MGVVLSQVPEGEGPGAPILVATDTLPGR